MGSALEQLLDLRDADDRYDTPPAELLPLQLEAANERLELQRRSDSAVGEPRQDSRDREDRRAGRCGAAAVRAQHVQDVFGAVADGRPVGPDGEVAGHGVDVRRGWRVVRGCRRPGWVRGAARSRRDFMWRVRAARPASRRCCRLRKPISSFPPKQACRRSRGLPASRRREIGGSSGWDPARTSPAMSGSVRRCSTRSKRKTSNRSSWAYRRSPSVR